MEYKQLIESRRNRFTWNYDKEISKEAIVEVFEEVYMNVPTKNQMFPYYVTLYKNDDKQKRKDLVTICHRNVYKDIFTDPGNPQMLAPWIIGISFRNVDELEKRYDPLGDIWRSDDHIKQMNSFEAGMLSTYIILGLHNRGYDTGLCQNCSNDPEGTMKIINSPTPPIFLLGVGYGADDKTYLDPRTNEVKNVPYNIDVAESSRKKKFTEGNPSFTDVFRL
jgi:hypothetical protein